MKKLTLIPLLFCACLFAVQQSHAQEAKKYDDPQWKNVVLVDFHSGKAQRAQEIIDTYYVPASEKAGTPGPETALMLHTGEWDMILIWAMSGGIGDMNWEVHPNNVKWRNALNEVCGGAEKATEILQEYAGLIARSSNAIARGR